MSLPAVQNQNHNRHRQHRQNNNNNKHKRNHCNNHNNCNSSHNLDDNCENEPENMLYSYAKSNKLCYFHMLNHCKYGQECQFTHGLACEKCHKNVFNPLLPIQNQIIEHKKFCISNRENTIEQSEFIFDNDEENKKENILSVSLNPKAKEFQFEVDDDEKIADTGCRHNPLLENMMEYKENDADDQFPIVECGICYEKISTTGRTLGLLANCNHVFCYNCIKKMEINCFKFIIR